MSILAKSTIAAVHDLSIKDVIEKCTDIKLKVSGINYVCCCPFHGDRNPSMSISPRRGVYKCFSCGKGGGSAVSFIMEYKNIDYISAIKEIAKNFNITIEYQKDERTAKEIADDEKRESMHALLENAQKFFIEQFNAETEEAARARDVAYGRWGEETCKEIGIGYAPRNSRIFIEWVKSMGISLDLCFEVGLIGKNEETGKPYATLRERLTIPVRTRTRQLVTYSARYIGDGDPAKYLNLKESLIFNKSCTLFGIDVAAREAKASGHLVIVEGGPDVIAMQRIGVMNTVATMGTALTESHLDQMKRLCSSLCFIPDSDPPKGIELYGAGDKAVMKSGVMALNKGFDVVVKEIPRSKEDDENGVKHDADSYIKSKDIYLRLESTPFVVWYTTKKLVNATTSELKNSLINEVAELMVNITDEILREIYIDRLSRLVGKTKMWRDAIKRAGRRLKEEENTKADTDDMPANILASLRNCGFIPRNGCYYTPDNDGNLDRCSNFRFEPVLHIKSETRSKRILKLINEKGEEDVVEFADSDLVTLRDFNKRLFSRGNYIWTGDPKSLTSMQRHLLEVTNSATHIEILGWNKIEKFYAFSNGIFIDGQFIRTDKLGVVSDGTKHYYLPAFSSIHADKELSYSFERMFKCNPQGIVSLSDFVGQIVKVYGTGGMISFAWTLACVFKDFIFSKLKGFPMLNLFGKKGTGKTELARALSSMFYEMENSPWSLSNTSIPVIGYILSHANNSMIILDEYTNDLMPQRIDLLKNMWGGTARSKMEDGVPQAVPVTSGVVIAGQYKPEDEAIFSRCIHLMYTKDVFSMEEHEEYIKLRDMVINGNTHLLLQILRHRDIFEKNYFRMYELTLNDVTERLGNESVDTRIKNNWVLVLTAFRVLEPHIDVPVTYNELFDAVVNGILYQNDKIRRGSDTSNFWLFVDAMHSQGKVKEKCHFIIKRQSSFNPKRGETIKFVEPKSILYLNFKAMRVLLEQRIAKQRTGSTLNCDTLESYLKSLPQFLGIKQQRFQMLRTNGELEEIYKSESGDSKGKKYLYANPSSALCFDYDKLKELLDLNLETYQITEEQMNIDEDDEDIKETVKEDAPEDLEDLQNRLPF